MNYSSDWYQLIYLLMMVGTSAYFEHYLFFFFLNRVQKSMLPGRPDHLVRYKIITSPYGHRSHTKHKFEYCTITSELTKKSNKFSCSLIHTTSSKVTRSHYKLQVRYNCVSVLNLLWTQHDRYSAERKWYTVTVHVRYDDAYIHNIIWLQAIVRGACELK